MKHRIENAQLGFEGRLAVPRAASRPHLGDTALTLAARFWYVLMALGQLLFFMHIAGFYSRAAFSGDLSRVNKVMMRGFVPGDLSGNTVLALHIAMAGVLTFAGPLQLLPQIRSRAPALHRWLGRTYLVTAVLGASSALYLSIWRGMTPGSFLTHFSVNLNGILILLCAGLALRYALKRDFVSHRAWALRLFLVVSGVWFFRVLFFFWLLVNQGPVGFDPERFEGPALTLISYLQFLLPLAMLEAYFAARRSRREALKVSTAVTLGALTLLMGVGIFAYTMSTVHQGTAL